MTGAKTSPVEGKNPAVTVKHGFQEGLETEEDPSPHGAPGAGPARARIGPPASEHL